MEAESEVTKKPPRKRKRGRKKKEGEEIKEQPQGAAAEEVTEEQPQEDAEMSEVALETREGASEAEEVQGRNSIALKMARKRLKMAPK